MSMRYGVSKKLSLKERPTALEFCPEKDKSLVQQHLNADNKLDSAKIVSRFFKDGVFTHTVDGSSRYMDATALTDFRECMTIKANADAAFNSLSPHIRDLFRNQRDFAAFCLDEANIDDLREWGLAKPLKVVVPPEPVEVIVKNPEPSSGSPKAV